MLRAHLKGKSMSKTKIGLLVTDREQFIESIARMTLNGEMVDGQPFIMGFDDAVETLAGLIINARALLEEMPAKEVGGWSYHDVQRARPDLTDHEAKAVLEVIEDKADASIGINWDFVEMIADQEYPSTKVVPCYLKHSDSGQSKAAYLRLCDAEVEGPDIEEFVFDSIEVPGIGDFEESEINKGTIIDHGRAFTDLWSKSGGLIFPV